MTFPSADPDDVMEDPPHPEEGAQRPSRRMSGHDQASWFETRRIAAKHAQAA
jgi:hypothetical protein